MPDMLPLDSGRLTALSAPAPPHPTQLKPRIVVFWCQAVDVTEQLTLNDPDNALRPAPVDSWAAGWNGYSFLGLTTPNFRLVKLAHFTTHTGLPFAKRFNVLLYVSLWYRH